MGTILFLIHLGFLWVAILDGICSRHHGRLPHGILSTVMNPLKSQRKGGEPSERHRLEQKERTDCAVPLELRGSFGMAPLCRSDWNSSRCSTEWSDGPGP